jgi:hypothetical protein
MTQDVAARLLSPALVSWRAELSAVLGDPGPP